MNRCLAYLLSLGSRTKLRTIFVILLLAIFFITFTTNILFSNMQHNTRKLVGDRVSGASIKNRNHCCTMDTCFDSSRCKEFKVCLLYFCRPCRFMYILTIRMVRRYLIITGKYSKQSGDHHFIQKMLKKPAYLSRILTLLIGTPSVQDSFVIFLSVLIYFLIGILYQNRPKECSSLLFIEHFHLSAIRNLAIDIFA